MSTIVQKPVFNITLTPLIKITFTLNDFNERYPITVKSVATAFKINNFITQGGTTIYNQMVMQTVTMLIPSLYIKSNDGMRQLKEFVKMICKRQELVCFLEFGSMQRVYDYRNFNK